MLTKKKKKCIRLDLSPTNALDLITNESCILNNTNDTRRDRYH